MQTVARHIHHCPLMLAKDAHEKRSSHHQFPAGCELYCATKRFLVRILTLVVIHSDGEYTHMGRLALNYR